jgi:nucleoside-diphosphate-sugar epimerase
MKFQLPLPPKDLEFIRLGGAALWPRIAGKRILITGATGFFGRWLIESLFAANDSHNLGVSVTALSRDPEKFCSRVPHLSRSSLVWVKGSIVDFPSDLFAGERFDLIVHLATEANLAVSIQDPAAILDVIAGGTRRVLELANRSGAKRLLFTSSGAVYGAQPRNLEYLSETYPGVPDLSDHTNRYAVSGDAKRQAELLCMNAAKINGLEAVVARGFTFGGPGLPLDSKFAFGNFIRDALRGGPITIQGDGTPIRSYMYAAELALWLWTLLLDGVPGRAYNVGSQRPISIGHLAEAISQEFGNVRIELKGKPVPGFVPERYVPSTLRAKDEIGLEERLELPDIIRRTADWHREMLKH